LNNPAIDIIQLQQDIAVYRDQQAYEKLFLYFYQPLIEQAFSMVKSREVAEEIYSDVLLKVWDLESALSRIDNLKAYLFISVKNKCLNYLASSSNRPVLDIDDIDINVFVSDSPEDNLLATELKKNITAAIQSLQPKTRMVYQLIREFGCSYKETAEITGISINTVEYHMTNALKKLAVSLRPFLQSGSN
jgi:RNA polymerase sigma-70 factor (ECF subfamily)